MSIRVMVLLLIIISGMFFNAEKAEARDIFGGDDFTRSWNAQMARVTAQMNNLAREWYSTNPVYSSPQQPVYYPGFNEGGVYYPGFLDDQPLEPLALHTSFRERKDQPLAPQASSADIQVASKAVAIACTNAQQDFFGFYPRKTMHQFQSQMQALQRLNSRSDLTKEWINQANNAVKLVGYLDSFRTTLAIADPQQVEEQMAPDRKVARYTLLDKAYRDMSRLISGQACQINKRRTATKTEAHVLLQAATSLGQHYAIEMSSGFYGLNELMLRECLVNQFYERYNLSDRRGPLVHNTILLKQSIEGAYTQIGKAFNTSLINDLLREKGLSQATLTRADDYRRKRIFPFNSNSEHLKTIIQDTQTTYDSRKFKRALRGIDILGMDPEMVYAKFEPYGKPAFDVLRNPQSFIGKVKEGFRKALPPSGDWGINQIMSGVEQALTNPRDIETIAGFSNGYITEFKGNEMKRSVMTAEDQVNEKKFTWLAAVHDFVAIYFYAEAKGLLDRFYSEATPDVNAPCLPGKLRCFQTWFETMEGVSLGAEAVLEKMFADSGGIEMSNAVKLLYPRYLEGIVAEFSAEEELNLPSNITPDAYLREALRIGLSRSNFREKYFTSAKIEEGIIDIVKENLPAVVIKFSKFKKNFPIAAFHNSKCEYAQLENNDDNQELIQKFRNQIKKLTQDLMAQTFREGRRPLHTPPGSVNPMRGALQQQQPVAPLPHTSLSRPRKKIITD